MTLVLYSRGKFDVTLVDIEKIIRFMKKTNFQLSE
jgi:hypothetical protein